MKTTLTEIYDYINTNDNTKEMYLIQWFEINKIKQKEVNILDVIIIKNNMKTIKETATVNYLGFYFDLEGNYTESETETYETCGYSAQFEITSATLNGINAETLIDNIKDGWDDLEELAIEYITN